jgi:hypothetical protein
MSKDKSDKNWFARHKVLTVIGIVVVIGIIASAAGSGKSSTTPSNNTTTDNTAKSNTEQKQEPAKPAVSAEFTSALKQATTYANTMHLSKQGVYDQLVSEYGGKFTAEAAQYAIDNVKADWNANALAQAKTYQNDMHLSPAAVRDQLVSAYGAKFTEAEADYAVANLNK